ncbi:hypothetical protein PGT21_027597 [Puccinia graminis f. sp. tritici]|uniref:Uncharacterized protein n=2 Tax=Puccinia graminis f. sp. tritici TaxID=56615 RepID=E3KTR1_PUCGT|nr:uncharacterized protein PGTG_13418 [Puccinia graminis f. sp. tritici CRL 75-36-700-3]EFP87632.1 hypothetical protein PGTG_13418 [Puccinia graminis f. sp. tritici CRL 75-36-700-3]KAA1101682.1 hypothetical protein PGT21_027597 [Puccinia graminis f. sp. tritici]
MYPVKSNSLFGLLSVATLSRCAPLSSSDLNPLTFNGAVNPLVNYYHYDKRANAKDVTRKVLAVAAVGTVDTLTIVGDLLRLQEDLRTIVRQLGVSGLNLAADQGQKAIQTSGQGAKPAVKDTSLDTSSATLTDANLVEDQSIKSDTDVKEKQAADTALTSSDTILEPSINTPEITLEPDGTLSQTSEEDIKETEDEH